MKIKNLLWLAGLILTGCTTTTVRTEHWELRRTSFLQRLEIPSVTILPDGTAEMTGYKTDGGTEAAAAITSAAVTAAIKSTVPLP